jgi:bifunctional N-acetylglucosamine-1-phosphate-uridyltransferase/glucosamine-1-phosphate-acetyltransferase GlmU-like protein
MAFDIFSDLDILSVVALMSGGGMRMTAKMSKAVVPMVGLGVVAAVAMGAAMKKPKKMTVQSVAGKALKAVGETVENFADNMKM